MTSERFGVVVAIVSSSLGAGAAVATRYLIGAADPFTLAAIRFGGGVFAGIWIATTDTRRTVQGLTCRPKA